MPASITITERCPACGKVFPTEIKVTELNEEKTIYKGECTKYKGGCGYTVLLECEQKNVYIAIKKWNENAQRIKQQ